MRQLLQIMTEVKLKFHLARLDSSIISKEHLTVDVIYIRHKINDYVQILPQK